MVPMHVPFRIHNRNNLIDKKDSYPIPLQFSKWNFCKIWREKSTDFSCQKIFFVQRKKFWLGENIALPTKS
jgi:hypothetical protein